MPPTWASRATQVHAVDYSGRLRTQRLRPGLPLCHMVSMTQPIKRDHRTVRVACEFSELALRLPHMDADELRLALQQMRDNAWQLLRIQAEPVPAAVAQA